MGRDVERTWHTEHEVESSESVENADHSMSSGKRQCDGAAEYQQLDELHEKCDHQEAQPLPRKASRFWEHPSDRCQWCGSAEDSQ